MSPDDLAACAAVLDRWFEAFNAHDIDALCEIADPAVEVIPLGGSETAPAGTTYHGREGLRSLLDASFTRYPHMRLDHDRPQPDGDQMLVDLAFTLDDGVAPATVRRAGCSYRISGGRIRRMRAYEPGSGVQRTRPEALSRREREVLSMIAGGRTIPEIADELHLSPFTVRTHVRNAKDKLHARTTAHAVALALEGGVLDV